MALKMKVLEIVTEGAMPDGWAVLRIRHVNSGQDERGNPRPERDQVIELERERLKNVETWREWPSMYMQGGRLDHRLDDVVPGAGFGLTPMSLPLREAMEFFGGTNENR